MLDRYPRAVALDDGTQVVLRPLQADDTDKLIALFKDVSDEDRRVVRGDVSDPDVLRGWTERLNPERVLPIVAEVDGAFWGEVTLHRRPKTPRAAVGEVRLFVQESARQRGIGSLLLNEVIEVGRDVGLDHLVAELFIDNMAMISAFERRGWERDAILPVYQLIVMRYNLARRPSREALDIAHADQVPPRRDWPDLLFDRELHPIPDQFNLADLLLDQTVASGWGRRPAILYHNEVVTYDLLLAEVKRLASSLQRLGVKAGDPVMLHLPNTPQAIAANFAVQRLGALSVPTIPLFSVHELALVAAESRAVAAFTTTDLLGDVLATRAASGGKLGAIIVLDLRDHYPDEGVYSYGRLIASGHPDHTATPRRRNEVGLLLYTSADSGQPRGTAHRLDGILAVLDGFGGRVWRVNEDDVIGSLTPLGFAHGFITCGLLPFRFGASVALPDDPLADSGAALVEAIRRHHVTLLMASPTTYRQILADPDVEMLDLASLRLCGSGGEPLTTETYEAWEARFEQPIFEGFGTTEMLYAFLSNAVGMAPRAGSLGRIVPGYEVKVVGDLGNELQEGEIGSLMVRGPTGILYWNNPDAQRRSVHNGWNRLRDYGFVDRDGYFWFVARRDDLIKTRGYRIDPTEVEAAICEHPRVREAGVIGLPDEMRGQRPLAYVVLRDPREADPQMARAIRASLDGRLADYKIPDEVVFVEALPRNAQGHLLRQMLRDQLRHAGGE